MILLDTNTCIYIIKSKPKGIIEKFKKHQDQEIGISSITLSELQFGVSKSAYPDKNQQALNSFVAGLIVFDYDDKSAIEYGSIRSTLSKQGKIIGSMDLLIAAHAKSLNATLVTNNIREFKRVDALKLDNWF